MRVRFTLLTTSYRFKANYARTTQFLHLLSTSTAGSPLDIWLPVNPNIKPQTAHQVAAGLFRNFKDNQYETSIEGYYKKFGNVIDFKDHPNVFGNDVIEPELRKGKGESYGIELMVRKNEGKITGWVSYSWSRVFRTVDSINNNKAYPAPFDKPNNINIVLNYALSKKVSLGLRGCTRRGSRLLSPKGAIFSGTIIFPFIRAGTNTACPIITAWTRRLISI